MAFATEPTVAEWTAADLVDRFGPIPLWRIRLQPPPGSATEEDVIEIHDHEDGFCELIDGVIVEKTVGTYESFVALTLGRILGNHVVEKRLGMVLGADGAIRLLPLQIRVPDVCFISLDRLPGGQAPRDAIANLVPDLAVEVISRSNTRREMERKLQDYFTAGVRLVWYVYPEPREVRVYTGPSQHTVVTAEQTLDGGEVLPGFQMSLAELFAEPGKRPKSDV